MVPEIRARARLSQAPFAGFCGRPTLEEVDLHRLRLSLVAAQLVGAATLLRSIAYDRWITVIAAVLLIAGATAAQRGRAWGVALAFAAAAAFPVAFAIGIAPAWFCLVGLIGALPFALTSRAFARVDKGATALLTVLAASTGAAGAIAWKQYAWDVFEMFPSWMPSREAQHGVALTLVALAAALVVRTGRGALGEGARVRVAQPLRVADASDLDATAGLGTSADTLHEFEGAELAEPGESSPARRRTLRRES